MTRIKCCGLTRIDDVRRAAQLGADAIGFVMTRKSKRFVEPAQAARLRDAVPPFVTTVALVMDDEPAFIEEVLRVLRPDMSAVRPVTAICSATATPRQPPTTAITVISEYQNTPSPRRLMAPKKMPMARRAPQRLAATHMRRSRFSLRGDGGAAFMDVFLGEGLHDRFEVRDDRFGGQPRDRRACRGSHRHGPRSIRRRG